VDARLAERRPPRHELERPVRPVEPRVLGLVRRRRPPPSTCPRPQARWPGRSTSRARRVPHPAALGLADVLDDREALGARQINRPPTARPSAPGRRAAPPSRPGSGSTRGRSYSIRVNPCRASDVPTSVRYRVNVSQAMVIGPREVHVVRRYPWEWRAKDRVVGQLLGCRPAADLGRDAQVGVDRGADRGPRRGHGDDGDPTSPAARRPPARSAARTAAVSSTSSLVPPGQVARHSDLPVRVPQCVRSGTGLGQGPHRQAQQQQRVVIARRPGLRRSSSSAAANGRAPITPSPRTLTAIGSISEPQSASRSPAASSSRCRLHSSSGSDFGARCRRRASTRPDAVAAPERMGPRRSAPRVGRVTRNLHEPSRGRASRLRTLVEFRKKRTDRCRA
jgi:hypothetical protein